MIATSPTTQPTPPAVAQPRRWSTSRLGDGQFATLLTLPVIVVLGLVVAYPTLYSLWMSFQRIDLIFGTTDAVGFANYRQALSSPEVWHSVRVTLHYTALVTIFAVAIAVGGALLLNERFRGRGFLMALVILPWAVSLYATAVVWKYIYSPEWGLLNAVLQQRLGLSDGPILFLSERGAVPALAVAHAWQIAPLGMYFVLATLQVIPEDLYKAAKVDRLGASAASATSSCLHQDPPLDRHGADHGRGRPRLRHHLLHDQRRPRRRLDDPDLGHLPQSFVNRNLGYGAAVAWILVVLTTIITTVYFLLLFRNGRSGRTRRPWARRRDAG
jgi:ABC-type sugar transport system permease subunit